MKGQQKAFTLIELLVVIVVIAILATISLVVYGNITSKAKEAKIISTVNSVTKKVAVKQSSNGMAAPDISSGSVDQVLEHFGIQEYKDDVVIRFVNRGACVAELSNACNISDPIFKEEGNIGIYIYKSEKYNHIPGTTTSWCEQFGGVSISYYSVIDGKKVVKSMPDKLGGYGAGSMTCSSVL